MSLYVKAGSQANGSGGGGSTTPGGSNTDVQYNNAGAFGGNSAFTFDGTNVGITNFLNIASLTISQLVVTDASKNLVSRAIGSLTDVGTDGIVITGGSGSVIGSGTSIAQHVADTTHNGYLSSTDWNTFNGKQAAGNYITALTGDGTASGPGSVALTFATVNSNVGSFTYGSFTVNAKGLITAASSGAAPQAPITIGALDAQAANANGLALVSNVLSSQSADVTHPGMVNLTSQIFAGAKSLNDTLTLNGDGSLAAVRYTPSGFVVAPSHPAWEAGFRAGQPYYSLTKDDGSSKTTIFDVALNDIMTMGSGVVLDAPALRTDNISTQAGSTVMDLTVSGVALNVGTASDTKQLVVQGNATQTSDLLEVLKSDTTVLLKTTNAGVTMASSSFVAPQLQSTIVTGTAPLIVASTTQVANLNAATAGSATTATTATNLAGGSGGTIPYQSAAGTTAMLANGSAGQILQSNGTTLAPSWVPAGAGTVTSVGLSVPATSILSVSSSPVTTSGTIALATTGTSGGIPYFSSTSQLTSSGALATAGVVLGGGAGATPTTLATSSSTTKVLTSGGTNTAPSWADVTASSFGTQSANTVLAGPTSGGAATPTFRVLGATDVPATVKTKTADYTALVTDTLILCNTNAFTITLPAASAWTSGIPLRIQKIGSDTNAITITRAGSDTINGATSTTLNTQYESVALLSNGSASWYILARDYPRGANSFTPTLAGVGTATNKVGYWFREGAWAHFNVTFSAGTTDGTNFSLTLPSGLAIDSTTFTQTGPVVYLGQMIYTAGSNILIFGSNTPQSTAVFYDGSDTAKVYVAQNTGGSNTGFVKAPANSIITSNNPVMMDFRVPISGWK